MDVTRRNLIVGLSAVSAGSIAATLTTSADRTLGMALTVGGGVFGPRDAFVMPVAAGSGDGSSWSNAATLASLPSLLASPSVGRVNIRADAGDYAINSALNSILLTAGGTPEEYKVVRGVGVDGNAMKANLIGVRQTTAHTGSTDKELRGYDVFKLQADYLEFRDLFLSRNGLTFDLSGTRRGLRVIDCDGSYYRFFVSNTNPDTGAFQGTLDEFVISGGVHEYLDVGTISLKTASNGLISGITGRGYGESFRSSNQTPIGIRFGTVCHDVIIEDCDFDEIYCRYATSGYFNGDAYVDELDCYNMVWRRNRGAKCTDGGFDLKSSNVVVEDCVSEGNKLNYRLWGNGVVSGCRSISPVLRGGSNPEAHINLPNSTSGVTAEYDMVDFEVSDAPEDISPIVLANGSQPSILRFAGGNVTESGSVGAPDAPLLVTTGSGAATLEFA